MSATAPPPSTALEIISQRQTKDSLGRRSKASPEECEAMVKHFETSGMTGAQYAKKHNINYETFCSRIWRVRALRRMQASVSSVPVAPNESVSSLPENVRAPAFREVDLPGRRVFPPNDHLTVTLPCGTKIEGGMAEEIARLIIALKGVR